MFVLLNEFGSLMNLFGWIVSWNWALFSRKVIALPTLNRKSEFLRMKSRGRGFPMLLLIPL